MAIADPKTYAVVKKDSAAAVADEPLSLAEQITALQQQIVALEKRASGGGGIGPEELRQILAEITKVQAEAAHHALNPSNADHLHVGHYTYPEGDLKRPRALKCQMFWIGYDMDLDITTAREVELLNLATPGTYTFHRLDGRPDKLAVRGEYAPDGTLSKLLFEFQAKEERESLPPMGEMLRQAFGVPTAEEQRIAELEAQIRALAPNLVRG